MLKENDYIIAFETAKLSVKEAASIINHSVGYQQLLENGYLKTIGNGYLSFQFVGVILSEDLVICVLPKYYIHQGLSFEKLFSDFIRVVKVLRKATSTDSLVTTFTENDSVTKEGVSKLALADSILFDYIENGFYQKEETILTANSNGEVDWNATICLTDPLIVKNKPIYHSVIGQANTFDEYNVITEVHKWIVNHFIQRFGKLLDYNIETAGDCVENLTYLGPINYLQSKLQSELQITFRDREIRILKQMLLFLEDNEMSSSNSLSLYGTKYFHTIWEKCCSWYFENALKQFSSFIPSPHWENFRGEAIMKDSLIPDIISTNEDRSYFFILDAKYYNVIYSNDPTFNLSGNPGVSDVSKQFVYATVFRDVQYKKKYNCFLFPRLQQRSFEVLGRVSFAPFGSSRVYNVFVSPVYIFESFLENRTIDIAELDQIATEIDSFE